MIIELLLGMGKYISPEEIEEKEIYFLYDRNSKESKSGTVLIREAGETILVFEVDDSSSGKINVEIEPKGIKGFKHYWEYLYSYINSRQNNKDKKDKPQIIDTILILIDNEKNILLLFLEFKSKNKIDKGIGQIENFLCNLNTLFKVPSPKGEEGVIENILKYNKNNIICSGIVLHTNQKEAQKGEMYGKAITTMRTFPSKKIEIGKQYLKIFWYFSEKILENNDSNEYERKDRDFRELIDQITNQNKKKLKLTERID